MQAEAEMNTGYAIVDGEYVTPDGEVIGFSDVAAAWRAEAAGDVEWALGIRAGIEADLAALRLRKAAAVANFEALEKKQSQRLAWWDWRFRSDVVAFARKALEGGKARTLQLENGAIKLRTTAGINKITDEEAAVAFVEQYRPDAVKVDRYVTVKDVLKVAAERGVARPVIAHFFFSTGPSESVAIETGVGDK